MGESVTQRKTAPSPAFGPLNGGLIFSLPGTVAIPSPFPAFGDVSYLRANLDIGGDDLVQLTQYTNETTVTIRLVRFKDLKAFRAFEGLPKDPLADFKNWPLQGPERLLPAIQGGKDKFILYVLEASPVVHIRQTALTAAEALQLDQAWPDTCSICHWEEPRPV
jgi:hypothetical protein